MPKPTTGSYKNGVLAPFPVQYRLRIMRVLLVIVAAVSVRAQTVRPADVTTTKGPVPTVDRFLTGTATVAVGNRSRRTVEVRSDRPGAPPSSDPFDAVHVRRETEGDEMDQSTGERGVFEGMRLNCAVHRLCCVLLGTGCVQGVMGWKQFFGELLHCKIKCSIPRNAKQYLSLLYCRKKKRY